MNFKWHIELCEGITRVPFLFNQLKEFEFIGCFTYLVVDALLTFLIENPTIEKLTFCGWQTFSVVVTGQLHDALPHLRTLIYWHFLTNVKLRYILPYLEFLKTFSF